MERDCVSVIIPCYNAESWIGQTLANVEAQSHPRLEIIVVDDGSTDRGAEVVEAFPSDRITLIRQPNAGAAKARNTGLAHAKGDFIQFLDADDLLSPAKLENQVRRLLQCPDAVACSAWARFYDCVEDPFPGKDGTDRDMGPVDWLVEAWREGGGMLFPGRWLIPRGVAEHAGPWDESLSLNDDGEYFTRVVLASRRILHSPDAVAYYRSGLIGSLSGTRTRRGWESGFRSVELTISHVLRQEDSERVRRCASLIYQRFAHASYPFTPDLANEAIRRSKELHTDRLEPGGGPWFKAARRLLGWRIARRLQQWSYERRASRTSPITESTRSSHLRI